MIKKPLSLKNAMHSLHIVETSEGYELQNAAGTAKYDAWGARREVNGIPEYFPSSISLNKRAPAPVMDKCPDSGGKPEDVSAQTVKLSIELDTTDAQKKLDELEDILRGSSAFKVLGDEVFINTAFIGGEIKHAGEIKNPQHVTQNYNISLGVNGDANVEAILNEALKNHDVTEKNNYEELRDVVRRIILLECFPGGVLQQQFGR